MIGRRKWRPTDEQHAVGGVAWIELYALFDIDGIRKHVAENIFRFDGSCGLSGRSTASHLGGSGPPIVQVLVIPNSELCRAIGKSTTSTPWKPTPESHKPNIGSLDATIIASRERCKHPLVWTTCLTIWRQPSLRHQESQ